jgi:membrane protein required for colicin V production
MVTVALWNWLDWLLALIILLSLLSAVREGFVRALIGLAALVVGLAVAAADYPRLAVVFGKVIHTPDLARGAAFLALVLFVLMIGSLISSLAGRLVYKLGMAWLDRLVGAVFGLIRGILFDAVLVLILVTFAVEPEAVRTSRLTPYVMHNSRALAALMPPELRAKFFAGLRDVERALTKTKNRALQHEWPAPRFLES